MGYIRHHAIIVTTWSEKRARKARRVAIETFGKQQVSRLQVSEIEGYHTFFVGPDGSKEGWEDSDKGDAARDSYVNWLGSQCDEDGGNRLSWVEVQYGDDNGEQKVTRADDLAPDYPWNPGREKEE